MRKVAVITASRADYGNYLPLLNALQKQNELRWVVVADNDADYIDIQSDTPFEGKPDWLIVSGDTMPMLWHSIRASESNIPIIHLGGGDSTTGACIDEQIRHAITRFAHLHFTQTQASADRLIRMGEEPWRVHVSGPLGIYAMPDAEFLSEHDLRTQLGLDVGKIYMNGVYTKPKPIVIVIQHPVSSQVEQAGEQMRITLEAVSQIPDIQPVIIYPNGEAGSEAMIQEIEKYHLLRNLDRSHPYSQNERALSFKNLPFLTFQSLLKYSSVIVGNSSCAIVEAPFYGVPAVNVGIRQEGRERADNVWRCDHKSSQIKEAINMALEFGRFSFVSPFQANPTGIQKIITALTDTPIDEKLLRKVLTF